MKKLISLIIGLSIFACSISKPTKINSSNNIVHKKFPTSKIYMEPNNYLTFIVVDSNSVEVVVVEHSKITSIDTLDLQK